MKSLVDGILVASALILSVESFDTNRMFMGIWTGTAGILGFYYVFKDLIRRNQSE